MCDCKRSLLSRDHKTSLFRWTRLPGLHDINECNPADVDDFCLITSFRWSVRSESTASTSPDKVDDFLDGLPLRLHTDRLRSSVHAFGWIQAEAALQSGDFELALRHGLLEHLRSQSTHNSTADSGQLHVAKIRLLVSKAGKLELQRGATFIQPPLYPFIFDSNPFLDLVQQPTLSAKVTLAQTPVQPSLFTQHKTTYRAMYTAAYQTVMKGVIAPTRAEVLLHNKSGEIMEASVSSVYFRQGNDWVTPAQECGGNLGTTRRWALEKGWCKEGKITLSEIQRMHGNIVWLSNAVRGFWPVVICIDRDEWEDHIREPNL